MYFSRNQVVNILSVTHQKFNAYLASETRGKDLALTHESLFDKVFLCRIALFFLLPDSDAMTFILPSLSIRVNANRYT